VAPISEAQDVDGPRRRAVIVGIDRYVQPDAESPRGLKDLRGAVSDAVAVYQTLRGSYGFAEEDIVLLLAPNDDEGSGLPAAGPPTRERILRAIESHLMPASRGDVAFFYYAGHGSQIGNLAEEEDDGFDETLVPADSAQGAPDIRDKELRRLFNRLLDAGADLTAMIDACHSGSVTRGYGEPARRTRYVTAASTPVNDPPPYGPVPSQHPANPALVISAALEDQVAVDGDASTKGFTAAFFDMLRSDPGASVATLVRRAAAVLRAAHGGRQKPLVEGPADRAFLRAIPRPASGLSVVTGEHDPTTGAVGLDVGRAVGILPGVELECGDGASLIVQTAALARSIATVSASETRPPEPGTVCRVSRWVVDTVAPLRVWVPETMDPASLRQAAESASRLRRSHPEWFASDPTTGSIAAIVRWQGGRWSLAIRCAPSADPCLARKIDLGRELESDSLAEAIQQAGMTQGRRAFVELPPAPATVAALKPDSLRGLVVHASDPSTAQFRLVGRVEDGQPEYAWLVPDAVESEWESPLPARTAWVGDLPRAVDRGDADGKGSGSPGADEHPCGDLPTAGCLADFAVRLARIHSWLMLSSPPGRTVTGRAETTVGRYDVEGFAYRPDFIEVRRGENCTRLNQPDPGRLLSATRACADGHCPEELPTLIEGKRYCMVLAHVAPELRERNIATERRYVYAFAVDRNGGSSLLYPGDLARRDDHSMQPCAISNCPSMIEPLVISLGRTISVSDPGGVESVFLVTTTEPIDPSVFTSGRVRGSTNALEQLLGDIGTRVRSAPKDLGRWNVSLFSFRTRAGAQ
jgi:hypothetical protein